MKYLGQKAVVTMCLTITCGLGLYNGVGFLKDEIIFNKLEEKCRGLEDLLYKTDKGIPVIADLDDPIGIVVQRATEEQKQEIVNAVNEMNEICPNLEYTIIDKNDLKIKNKIYVYPNTDIEDEHNGLHTLGLARFKYNNYYGKLEYPMTVYIDPDVAGIKDEHGVTLFSYVLKHELMHTLGFKDLYDSEYFNKTIMYYNIHGDINNFTDFDVTNIRKLYNDGAIKVEKPEKFEINSYYKKEDDELNF